MKSNEKEEENLLREREKEKKRIHFLGL